MKVPMAERFWSKVDRSGSGCWEWQACRNAHGYGRFSRGSYNPDYAHRVAYELANGPIPAGLEVCHHCDNPPCCNPAHLFLGTMADNQRDKTLKGRVINPLTDALKQRTHCNYGHPFDEANTLWRPDPLRPGKKYRTCRICLRNSGIRSRRRHGVKPKRKALTEGAVCVNGHVVTPDNAFHYRDRGRECIQCLTCRRASEARCAQKRAG